MTITEVKIVLHRRDNLRGFASVVFDCCFVVRGIKIIEGEARGLFLSMPARQLKDGTFQDVAHPISQEMRDTLESVVLDEYEAVLAGHLAGEVETHYSQVRTS